MTAASVPLGMFDTSDPAAPGYYAPSQMALLLLDFHQIFIQRAGGSNASAALRTAAGLRSWAKLHGIKVIHCLIDVHGTPLSTCKGAARLIGIVTGMATDGGDEPEELRKDRDHNEPTFMRRPGHVSALKSPGLEEYLQSQGIKSLILTGLSTSGCVLRTALAACDADYIVTVMSDGCADGGERLHDLALEVVDGRGYVATAAIFRESYDRVRDIKTD